MTIPGKVEKQGNSAMLRLTVPVLRQLGVKIGSPVMMTLRNGALTVESARPRFSLEELCALCNPKARMPKDLKEFSSARRVGRELL